MLFLAVAVFGVAIFLGVRWYSRRSKQKSAQPGPESSQIAEVWRSLRPLIRQGATYAQHVPLLGIKERYARQLEKAGLRFDLSADEFLAIKAGAVIVMTGVALFVQVALRQNWLIAIILIFLGVVYPDIALSAAVRKQERAFLRALPGFLDLLAIALEAGMGFDSAVLRLTSTLEPGPLTWRFQAYLRGMNVGKTRSEALREMARKVDLPDFTSFANAVIQATDTGASIGPVMRTESAEMLSRRFDRAEKAAHELPIRILLPLFVFVFPATFIMVLGPVYFQFMASGAGSVL